MEYMKHLFLLNALFANVAFVVLGQTDCTQQCYPDLGCFACLSDMIPLSPETISTQFLLFTQNTQDDSPTILDYLDTSTLGAFDSTKVKTFFVVHGMFEDSTAAHHVATRKALLNQFDANVIMVDWNKGTNSSNYKQSAINTQLVGRQIARLVQLLNVQNNLNVKIVHLIGLSLGAHTSGFAGKWYQNIASDTIGRISGNDPAGPFFEQQSPDYHLSSGDADFVDAIHTNAGFDPNVEFGIMQTVGQVDFYVNGGRFQDRCSNPDDDEARSAGKLCSHFTSVNYFIESISNDCPFTSNPCPGISNQASTSADWENNCAGSCGDNCGRMGYYSDTAPGRGEQYLTTNNASPYCKN